MSKIQADTIADRAGNNLVAVADINKSSQVTYDGGTVEEVLDSAKPLTDYTALRAYTGRATAVRITTPGIAGFFQRDADTTTADNGGTVIVDASGRRWKRVFDGAFNVLWFGVPLVDIAAGTESAVVTDAIQSAIAAVSASGGGTLFFPAGTYHVTKPIEMANGVDCIGASNTATTLRKTNTVTTSDGYDAVVFALNKFYFKFHNFRIRGNRVKNFSTGVVTVTTDGVRFKNCAYFDIHNVFAFQCVTGFRLAPGCYTSSIRNCTAQLCQSYGFEAGHRDLNGTTGAGSTSLVFSNTTAWGTGGGWRLSGCIYTQLLGCACDESDSGGRPGDPFGESGGDYQNPAYIFRIEAAQGIVIVGPGMENCWSQYLYAEGAFLTIISPYSFNINCNATNYYLIRLAGASARNDVSIINPRFAGVKNNLTTSSTRRLYLVENTNLHRLNITGEVIKSATFGTSSQYPTDGMFTTNEEVLIDYNQRTMIVGQESVFFKPETSDIANIQLISGVKNLVIDAVSAADRNFDFPLPGAGFYKFQIDGTFVAAGFGAEVRVVETDGTTTNILKSWTNAGSAITVNEWLDVAPTAGFSVFFRVRTRATTQEHNFTRMKITRMSRT